MPRPSWGTSPSPHSGGGPARNEGIPVPVPGCLATPGCLAPRVTLRQAFAPAGSALPLPGESAPAGVRDSKRHASGPVPEFTARELPGHALDHAGMC